MSTIDFTFFQTYTDTLAVADYSAQEVNTGKKWVDNEEIFTKTVLIPEAPEYGGASAVDLGFVVGSYFNIMSAMVKSIDNKYRPLPYVAYRLANDIRIYLSTSREFIHVKNGDAAGHVGGWAIIEYTK